MKCEKCGYESSDSWDFCGTRKMLDGELICRTCDGKPNKDAEGKHKLYLALGQGEKIKENEDKPRGCY